MEQDPASLQMEDAARVPHAGGLSTEQVLMPSLPLPGEWIGKGHLHPKVPAAQEPWGTFYSPVRHSVCRGAAVIAEHHNCEANTSVITLGPPKPQGQWAAFVVWPHRCSYGFSDKPKEKIPALNRHAVYIRDNDRG